MISKATPEFLRCRLPCIFDIQACHHLNKYVIFLVIIKDNNLFIFYKSKNTVDTV